MWEEKWWKEHFLSSNKTTFLCKYYQMKLMEDENGNRNHPLDYFRWLLKNLSISRLCCVFVYQARRLCDNMCSGLEINDLVILSAHPPDCHASFIYHQKCLSATCFFFACSINPSLFELFAQSTKGDVFVFYWVTRNTVNTMMCSPVVSEVIRMLNGSKKIDSGANVYRLRGN